MLNKKLTAAVKTTTLLIASALCAHSALASGYHFGAQSVSTLSTANAAAAEAADPSTIYFNPAGLTELDGTQVTGNLFAVLPNVKYSDGKGTYADGTAVQGETSGKMADSAVFVPQLYASHKLNDKVTLGLGVYVPFASATDYEDDSVLRYNVNETSVKSFDINPTVAFKINDHHSVGVGVIAQYFDAKLVKFADFTPVVALADVAAASQGGGSPLAQQSLQAVGAAVAAGSNGTPQQQAIAAAVQNLVRSGDTPQNAVAKVASASVAKQLHTSGANYDGRATLKGNDWGFGYNLGWMWNINDNARLGVSYRSKISHTLSGDTAWDLVGSGFQNSNTALIAKILQSPAGATSPLTGVGYVKSEGTHVKVVTPESLSVHGMFKATPKLNLFGNLSWTRHSRLDELNIELANEKWVSNPTGKTNVSQIIAQWRDTYSIGLGASYQLNDKWQLRGGVNYDRSPVKSADHRLPTMPDNNRLMFSVGAKYAISPNDTLNLAYAYMRVQDAELYAKGPDTVNVDSHVASYAKTKSSANILGVQYTHKF